MTAVIKQSLWSLVFFPDLIQLIRCGMGFAEVGTKSALSVVYLQHDGASLGTQLGILGTILRVAMLS